MSEDRIASIEERRLNFEFEKHSRERWWREEELVNQRTTWLLTTQGVLGTAFGFIKYRIAELSFTMPAAPPVSDGARYIKTLQLFADGLTGIGVVSSLVTLMGIYAAHRAQRALQALYGSHLGVTRRTTGLGHFVALSTPLLCVGAWLLAFGVLRR